MTITTILFDFGGVLVEPLDMEAVIERRTELAQSLGFDHWEKMWNHFYVGDIWLATKTGGMTDAEMWAALLEPLGLTNKKEQASFTEKLFAGEGVRPQMRYLLDDLHGRYRLAILSNASDVLESVLKVFEIDHYFDDVINSHRIGAAKPDVEAYRIALDRLDAEPAEVLFIDDQERNTKAAASLGIDSYHYTTISELIDELSRREII